MRPGFGLLLLLTGSGLLADSFFAGEDAPQKGGLAFFLMMAGISLFSERGGPTRPCDRPRIDGDDIMRGSKK